MDSLAAFCAHPKWGSNPQPCMCSGQYWTQPFWCTGRCSSNLSHPARVLCFIFLKYFLAQPFEKTEGVTCPVAWAFLWPNCGFKIPFLTEGHRASWKCWRRVLWVFQRRGQGGYTITRVMSKGRGNQLEVAPTGWRQHSSNGREPQGNETPHTFKSWMYRDSNQNRQVTCCQLSVSPLKVWKMIKEKNQTFILPFLCGRLSELPHSNEGKFFCVNLSQLIPEAQMTK